MPVNITQDQLDTWVTEAEEGYDPEVLKKRGRGRPGRGAEPAQVVAVRLTADELSALDRLATEKNLTRSELVRQAINALTAAREQPNPPQSTVSQKPTESMQLPIHCG